MEAIAIPATAKTPLIEFNPDSGVLKIKGRSSTENSKKFYNPLIDWCHEYSINPQEKTIVSVHLEHFNTISSKSLLDFFKILRRITNQEKEVEVKWYYEKDDEELREAGLTFQEITGLNFQIIPL